MTENTTAPSVRLSALPPAVTEFLTAIADALDIPHPATYGGQEAYDRVLGERAMHAKIALRSALEDHVLGLDWNTQYLRERLAEHPPTGYVTCDQAHAALGAGKTWSEAVALPAGEGR
ncbi:MULTISPECIES: hypothetical protein [Streptomyces]|uniref:hypothetical protein n=1 Tax=Streptomyces TaxID=1883 RepID=UPI0004CBA2AA|nr:hypothetical protein [Streptomyces achromogenes]